VQMKKFLKRLGRSGFTTLAWLESRFDRAYLVNDVQIHHTRPEPWDLPHYVQPRDGRLRVLEIGSREVTGPSKARELFADANADYVGFDYYPGRNVDVVGDVHRLASYFGESDKFDIIYTIASFEHFAMPWIVALEIAKLLKVGGVVYVKTHFSFGTHERPWNFFQFSDMGLRVLFPRALGFECLESGMSNPIVGRFSALADRSLRLQPVRGLYCGSEYLGRKVEDPQAFDWSGVSVEEVVMGTTYPAPAK
jgi:hypothetical protein